MRVRIPLALACCALLSLQAQPSPSASGTRLLAWVDVDIEPGESLLAVPVKPNRSEAFQRALKNRPDLIEARLAVEKSAVAVKFCLNPLFPPPRLVRHYWGLGFSLDSSTAQ